MYVELHASSAFSFLRGGSLPERLAEAAAENGIPSIAQLDRDNVSGAVRFHRKAKKLGIKPVIGAEVTMFDESALPVIPVTLEGYQNLCQLLTTAKLRAEKGEHRATFDDLEQFNKGLICLSGSPEDGLLPSSIRSGDKDIALHKFDRLRSIFKDRFYLELQRHLRRDEERINQHLIELSERSGVPLVATNGVLYADKYDREISDLFTCLRNSATVGTAGRLMSLNAERFVKPSVYIEKLFSDQKRAVEMTGEIASMVEFSMDRLGYTFPDYEAPDGETMQSFLRRITRKGTYQRYGGKVPKKVAEQIEKELHMIEKLDLCGYFLVVWDIVDFCRRHDILVQGRGSAANSAVCYVLGITAVDPATSDLLFERFLSEEREECPDIDLDLPSGPDRELAIQYLYQKYGEHGAAMTANIITYRQRSAIRETGKVFEIPEEQVGKLAKLASHFRHSDGDFFERLRENSDLGVSKRIAKFAELVERIQDYPRHLGQHSGGMIVFKGKLDHVVPLEPATMPGRVVVQWDKDDCANVGIIKVDLLGLGMLAAVRDTVNLVRDHHGEEVDLATIPKDDPLVYKTLQKADTVGLFQVESRAQMSSLPKTLPTKFYDLVVQVAIIRPGPIVGQMYGPYVRRRLGQENVDYMDPRLKPILQKTLGVPLFQEQLLKIAMVAADFSGGEAEELRRAFGFKRADKKVPEITARLMEGMKRNGINEATQEKIAKAVNSFAIYGFPESHAASFALITYASAYLKCHYLAAFTTGLLNNQPMGFYSPATLIKDAERHGQEFLPIDIQSSDYLCSLEGPQKKPLIRIGLMYVKGLRKSTGLEIEEERKRSGPFGGIADLLARVPSINKREIRQLSLAGALTFGKDRRGSLWDAEREIQKVGPLLKNLRERPKRSPLPLMNELENLHADFSVTGLTVKRHPMALIRDALNRKGILSSEEVTRRKRRSLVSVAGAVICRQRPGTAKGVLFISLEDEMGISNFIVMPDIFDKFRQTIIESPYLLIKGQVENNGIQTLVKGMYFERLSFISLYGESHDFH
ncbi:MAG: DNA polymerase III subunit alpha [Acidobacteria bacterium]|nr:MAG: DNA polymerase III subunit alpha [Acidobacteriota bacterium]REJ98116.1 MAG: DNA polymerase III subunit alpha [Acidobacteriota bacterium]REK16859.1 MAG: DNA polymerase III subunit alpha [Acidobacteriota bacterium]REK42770.1 MAG: DNA polymerase III subunit alpha [Acidobacteriota bacterium]